MTDGEKMIWASVYANAIQNGHFAGKAMYMARVVIENLRAVQSEIVGDDRKFLMEMVR